MTPYPYGGLIDFFSDNFFSSAVIFTQNLLKFADLQTHRTHLPGGGINRSMEKRTKYNLSFLEFDQLLANI